MKKIIKLVCILLVLFISCGDADEPEAAMLENEASGMADITIDGEPVEITSVSCKEDDYSYLVEASGPDHSLEISFGKDYSDNADGEYDFSRSNNIEMYIYGSESTATYRDKSNSDPGIVISGSETHAEGTAELARYNDEDDVLTLEVDIRCEA